MVTTSPLRAVTWTISWLSPVAASVKDSLKYCPGTGLGNRSPLPAASTAEVATFEIEPASVDPALFAKRSMDKFVFPLLNLHDVGVLKRQLEYPLVDGLLQLLSQLKLRAEDGDHHLDEVEPHRVELEGIEPGRAPDHRLEADERDVDLTADPEGDRDAVGLVDV